MPETPSADLLALAERHGVTTAYDDWQGRPVTVSEPTLRAVLAALGVDASGDEAVRAALVDADLAPWRRTLPATVVTRAGRETSVPVHVPHGSGVHVTVELEDGTTRELPQLDVWVDPREVDGTLLGQATFALPGDLPLGWHRLTAHVDADPLDPATTGATLVVTPERLELPGPLAAGRVVGVMAQLYQARSARSWGIGDLGDLADLMTWAAGLGCEYALINPLHAAEPIGPMEPSPYLPTTRRFANPIYLRVEDVPGHDALDAWTRAIVEHQGEVARELDTSATLDRDAVWAAKRIALKALRDAGEGRADADYAAYLTREGEGLARFATWCALAEHHGLPWREWPEELRDPASPAVAAFRETYADEVDFHSWLQFQLERQLARVQRGALDAGMTLGVVHDLAVGVHPDGADAWGLGSALARGVKVGAPPDQFNQLGQDWSQPPWRPDRLAELGYAPFRDMVRTVLRDSGGIRVDHILGLFRLWWIPDGRLPLEGTYVRYDHEALIGILVLEAQRAGAVVIGEDLGLVPPITRDYLAERGLFGTSILWFEWRDGVPVAPEDYRELCLSSVTTHDLPPTAGYLALEHIAIRERLELLTRPVEQEREHELAAIDTVRRALVERGLLDESAGPESMTVALHRWLALTPSRMLGVALADLVGDRRAINQPGTDEEYPNWRLPLAGPDGRPILLEEAYESDLAAELVDALHGEQRPRPPV